MSPATAQVVDPKAVGNEANLKKFGELLTIFEVQRLAENATWRGKYGIWDYIRYHEADGDLIQRTWHGMGRAGQNRGRWKISFWNRFCVSYVKWPGHCLARIYKWGKVYYGFDSEGRLKTKFRVERGNPKSL